MLTAREAAEITKSTSVTDKQRAQIIWDNQIEDRIKGQASHGYNELTYIFPESEIRYGHYLGEIAVELGFSVVRSTKKDYLVISWAHLCRE